jgi:hypothetical protein
VLCTEGVKRLPCGPSVVIVGVVAASDGSGAVALWQQDARRRHCH